MFYINKDLQYFKTPPNSIIFCIVFYINKDLQYFKTSTPLKNISIEFYINKDLQYFKTEEQKELNNYSFTLIRIYSTLKRNK